ncbi:MAG TPA: hypothetical protein DEF57_00125 [Candidatus Magasanikbacteria bacterium]|nr:hypothetical protein [Candidatus Magasanikbacteria bacterium]
MSYRTKIFFFGGIGLLIIIGLVLALGFKQKPVPVIEGVVQPVAVTSPESVSNVAGNVPVPVEVKKMPSKAEVTQAAKDTAIKNTAINFAERFGSYSVAANFSNFEELKPFSTPTVVQWLDQYKTQLLAKQGADFVGITTKVVSTKIISSSEAVASVLISTQQSETYKTEQKTTYKDMLVKLVWQNSKWLVDGAYWQ